MKLAANLVAAEVRRRSVGEVEYSASSPRRLRVLRLREQVAFTLIEMLDKTLWFFFLMFM